jgi:hypothetical protein
MIRFFMAAAALLPAASVAQASFLTDSQLYFDPNSITPGFYTRVNLPDLATTNTFTVAAGTDPVTGANILPVLKPGTYGSGYVFSQNDYLQTPNVDYKADLTSGTLTAEFDTAALYELRVDHQSGATDIYTVFADAGLKEKNGAPDALGAVKKLDPLPSADLILVEKSDGTMDDSAAIWTNGGRNVQRVTSRADAVQQIIAASKKLGRKIHVEIDGHGTSANISTGAGKQNIADKQIDLTSVAAFQKQVDQYVSELTFQGCSVGKGPDGKKFLDMLAQSIPKVGAWDSPVTVVDQSYFTVDRNAQFLTVTPTPEPSGFVLFALGLSAFGGTTLVRRWRHGR